MPALGTALGLPFVRKAGPLTPPTLAPVLMVISSFMSTMAALDWTASNKTGSAGFGYRIDRDIDGGGFAELTTTTDLSYNDNVPGAAGETYTYRITPYNAAGDGPASNDSSVVLPGL